MTERLARRCCSYYGYLRNSDSIRYRRRHRIDHTMRRATRIYPPHTEGTTMLQTVSSPEPLEEVSYYPRGDGLADIRIRRNITTVMHGDGETAWTEYTADEAYTIRDLTEQGSHRTGRQHLARLRAGIQIGQSAPRRLGGVQPRSGRGIGRNLPAAVRG